MPRISDQELERLKSEVSVERLVQGSGLALKRSGKDWVTRCPFHADDTASLVVTPTKNLWHCSGCGAAGGPIDWVIKTRGVSFRHAVELLREGLPILVDENTAAKEINTDQQPQAVPLVARSTIKTLAAPVALDADDQALLNQTVEYYHERLLISSEAQQYLGSRGLTHPDLIKHFKLGVADRTLGLRLPEKNRKAGAQIREKLTHLGLYRGSGHEHFNGSLIVPVLNEHGDVVEIYGRKLLDNLRAGTPKHLYLPANEARGRGVFNVQALMVAKEIILCESLIDAMTLWSAGYRHVTSAYGVEGLTHEHVGAFKRYGTQRVLIAFDRDEAGDRGAEKVSALLMSQGIECFRVQWPKGMDANEFALKVQPAAKALGTLLRQAVWLGKGNTPTSEKPTAKKLLMTESIAELVARVPVVPVVPLAAGVEREEPTTPAAKEKTKPDEPAVQNTAPEAPMPASPLPSAPANDLVCEVKDNQEIVLTLGASTSAQAGPPVRVYRVRGLAKNQSFELLKINLLVSCKNGLYVDTLDLYSAKQRASYVTHASLELQVREELIKHDLGRVLLKLEQLQEASITQTLQAPVLPQMSAADHESALHWLQSPDLLQRITDDLSACGLVGERTNKLVAYLAAVSRKLDKPLGVVVQSSSASGKTSLLDAVLALVPAEDKVQYSAMTGQSLFYMGELNLKHKVLAIAEEEGASRASYALKLLQSEGELTMASTGKDPHSGNLVTQAYRVEGPVALLLTTTARDVDEELMNRCLVLAVDEARAQTRLIHAVQRERRTLAGLAAQQQKKQLIGLHHNVQRLLKPLAVLNPYAPHLTFPDQSTRLRRDHEKYVTLIDTIALLHQHQRLIHVFDNATTRDVKNTSEAAKEKSDQTPDAIEYIEVQLSDIEQANAIAVEVLGRSLDELPPQTRRLLRALSEYVKQQAREQGIDASAVRFTRRSVRESLAWGDTQLRVHLERLVALEYVLMRREGAGGQYVYELVYEVVADVAENAAQVLGLISSEALAKLHADHVSSDYSIGDMTLAVSPSNSSDTIAKLPDSMLQVAPRLRVDSGPIAQGFERQSREMPPITSLAAKAVGIVAVAAR
jgi:DNA primase